MVQSKGKKVETDQEKALREEMEALQVGDVPWPGPTLRDAG